MKILLLIFTVATTSIVSATNLVPHLSPVFVTNNIPQPNIPAIELLPATQATFSVSQVSSTNWAKWQNVPSVPKHIEKAVAIKESSDDPKVGVHRDGVSVGWFGVTPNFVQFLIDKKWIPNQTYDLNNGWENRWIFRRGMQYFYKDTKSWYVALMKYHSASDSAKNREYADAVVRIAAEIKSD